MCVSACVCERRREKEQEGERKGGREGKKERKTWDAHVEAWISLVEVQSFSLPCGVVQLEPKSSDLIPSTSIHWNISQIQNFKWVVPSENALKQNKYFKIFSSYSNEKMSWKLQFPRSQNKYNYALYDLYLYASVRVIN